MAKDLLIDDFQSQREKIIKDWQVKVEVAKLNGTAIPDHPSLPTYPTDTDIIFKAQSLNSFVSNPETKIITKKSIDKTTA
jgi:glutamate mutase epsilon subunit